MTCPKCGSSAPALAGRCPVCGTRATAVPGAVGTSVLTPTPVQPFDADGETRLADPGETVAATPPAGAPATRSQTRSGQTVGPGTGPLIVGQNFGSRYHIIRLLGAGGMGSVYQAWDQELEVAVAVKVIRPDVTADPVVALDLERRFKRELLLARQVTDRHVVRIHDIGEIEGIKYITMPYVHGSDLATILKREGRLPVPRALSVARQVASGLIAAHEAGVVHRDLKPANIMVDEADHALIMDFGIARSTSGATAFAMTVGAQVIGTVEYMAPEQAKGETVDQRADLYAFGLILRDMLLGGRHASSTSGVAELMGRMQSPPPPVRSVDATIPEALDTLVTRCLQPDPAARYQSAGELLRDIDRVAGGGTASHEPFGTRWARALTGRRLAIAGAVLLAVLGLAVAAVLLKSRTGGSESPTAPTAAVSRPAISLAVLPFRNASGDPTLDSLGTTLSELLATDLGAAAHIRTVPPERVHEVLRDLRVARHANLAPADLARIADLASAGSILWGQYVKFGDEIRIDATLQAVGQDRPVPLKVTAVNQASMLTAVGQLAQAAQTSLAAGSEDVEKQLRASAWRPSTQSFDALRLYNEGLQLSRDGDQQTAAKRFESAVQEDPQFALAHSALARAYDSLGFGPQAGQASRRAMSLAASLTPQEQYLVAAAHHLLSNEPEKGIAALEKLLAVSPGNAATHLELGGLYEQTGTLDKAAEQFRRAVELDPKHVVALTALGRVAIRRGAPQDALQPLNNALSLSVQLSNDASRANVLHAIGVAYKRLGKSDAALTHYEESLAIKRRIGQKGGAAVSLGEIAQIQETLGRPQQALQSYREALALQREIGDKARMSSTLINLGSLLNEGLGKPDAALPLLQEALSIVRDLGNRSAQGLALNSIGTVYLAKGQYSDAQTYFEGALELREQTKVPYEMADTLHNLGETLNKMGRYDRALASYMRALQLRRDDGDKRNEAIESYSIGTIFDYQGRFGAAIKSKGEALQAFRDLKQRDFWFGEILGGYGSSLALGGRLADSAKILGEASALARDLQNPGLVAQISRFQAERMSFAGDAGAVRQAEQASQAASRTADRSLDLLAQAEVARTAADAQPTRAAAARLADLSSRAESAGLAYLSIQSAIESAHTLLRAGDHQQARQAAERAVARAEGAGLRVLVAKGQYVVAAAMRSSKDPQARRQYAAALQLLDEIRREEGNDKLLDRADLKAVHAECTRWSQAG